MTQILNNYARVLYELCVPEEQVLASAGLLEENPALFKSLREPLIPLREKERVIDRVFPSEMRRFLKVVCRNKRAGELLKVFEAYKEYKREQEDVLSARLFFVTPPTDAQLVQIEHFLCTTYEKKQVIFEMKEDSSLIGGFILQAGNFEYDYSYKGRYKRLKQTLIGR